MGRKSCSEPDFKLSLFCHESPRSGWARQGKGHAL
jgi:hypothetical protein